MSVFYKLSLSFCCLFSVYSHHAQTDSWNVDLLDNWYDSTVALNNMYFRFNEVWGFNYEGSQYAVMGSSKGVHLFQIMNDSIHFLWEKRYAQKVVHRDYHNLNGYLYAGSAEAYGLYRYDLSYLPDSLYLDTIYDFTNIHNLFIDTSTSVIYLDSDAGAVSASYAIDSNGHVSDIPIHVLPYYAHDFYARNDTLFANCEGNGLLTIDYNEPNPQYSQLQFYPDMGYNHSGWLNESGDIYAFIDETEGKRIKVCDVTDLSQIEVLSLIDILDYETLIPHNCMIKNNLLYVSYYKAGLQIFDISDPTLPQRIGYYDTYDLISWADYAGAWGVYCFLSDDKVLVSDMNSGLYLFRFNRPYQGLEGKEQPVEIEVVNSYISVDGNLMIKNSEADPILMRLYDLSGRIIANEKLTFGMNVFDLMDFSSGKYILQFYKANQCVKTSSLIKGG